MKIAICNVQEFNPSIGGVERVSISLAQSLMDIDKSYEFIFVACRKSSYHIPYQLPAPHYFLPDSDDYSIANVNALTKLIQEEGIHILLNQNAHSEQFNRMCYEAKQQTKVRLISVLHFSPDTRIRENRHCINWRFLPVRKNLIYLLRDLCTRFPLRSLTMYSQTRLMANLYSYSDRVILLSKNYIPIFQKITKITDTSKLTYINNMLSFPYETSAPPKKKQILFCGRLNYAQKRPDRILMVWEQLQDKLPDWELIIMGDGPFRKKLEEIAQKLHLRRIHIEGFSQNPICHYKKSPILAMTSNHEGFALVLTEAMQYGCVPVAFQSFDSITDIITDGETGKLVPPFNITLYAQAIYELATSNNLDTYASQAIQSMKRLTPNNIAQQWHQLFCSIST